MPSLTYPETPHYVPAPPSQENLDYADLAIIDLAKAGTPEGRTALAIEVRDALTSQGFFYAINHGYTQAQTDRIFDIADIPFTGVRPEEMRSYHSKIKETGSYQGFKPRQFWYIDGGVHDQVEHYNINHDITKRLHPQPLRPFLPEIEAFAKHNHFNVLHPILRLLALSLELPEDTLVNTHGFDAVGETYVRFMKYYPRTEEEEEKTKNVWFKGHTDIGSVTISWSQPVAALQILSPDGKWRWIKHINNAIIINTGDALEFLSGSFYKPTIHRVIQPPADQRNYTRLGLFYFCLPNDDVKLAAYAESPVVQKVEIQRRCEDEHAPTMEVWRKGRTSSYGRSDLKKTESGVEEDIINGLVVKYYTKSD